MDLCFSSILIRSYFIPCLFSSSPSLPSSLPSNPAPVSLDLWHKTCVQLPRLTNKTSRKGKKRRFFERGQKMRTNWHHINIIDKCLMILSRRLFQYISILYSFPFFEYSMPWRGHISRRGFHDLTVCSRIRHTSHSLRNLDNSRFWKRHDQIFLQTSAIFGWHSGKNSTGSSVTFE